MNLEGIRQVAVEIYGNPLISKQYENDDFIFINK